MTLGDTMLYIGVLLAAVGALIPAQPRRTGHTMRPAAAYLIATGLLLGALGLALDTALR